MPSVACFKRPHLWTAHTRFTPLSKKRKRTACEKKKKNSLRTLKTSRSGLLARLHKISRRSSEGVVSHLLLLSGHLDQSQQRLEQPLHAVDGNSHETESEQFKNEKYAPRRAPCKIIHQPKTIMRPPGIKPGHSASCLAALAI